MTTIFSAFHHTIVIMPSPRDYAAAKLFRQPEVKAGETLHYIALAPMGFFRFAYLHRATALLVCEKLEHDFARQSLAYKAVNLEANYVRSEANCLVSDLMIEPRQ